MQSIHTRSSRYYPQIAYHPTRRLIFLTTRNLNCVQVFSRDGKCISRWGLTGSADGQLQTPSCIAIHTTCNLVFVGDMENHRIQVFTLDGTFVRKHVLNGLCRIVAIAVDEISDLIFIF